MNQPQNLFQGIILRVQLMVLLVLLSLPEIFAQKEAYNWYFGYNAGITFNTPDGIPVSVTNSAITTTEGCATISDANGNLLFYSDGSEVYNRNHVVMPNGTGLMGSSDATQSCIAIPKPGSNHLYYIFTVPSAAGMSGLRYSLINMELDNGLGAIDSLEKNIQLSGNVTEQITAVRHANNTDYWVITHQRNNNIFCAFQVMATGIKTIYVASHIGSIHSSNYAGYMKVSPDGTRLSCPYELGLEIFGFNNATGQVIGPVVGFTNPSSYYGTEFSPNSQLLYYRTLAGSSVYQADLSSGDSATIVASQILVGMVNGGGSLQLGPDGKMYLSSTTQTTLSLINYPNIAGIGCGLKPNAINLTVGSCSLGLPSFIQSFFNPLSFQFENLCFNDTTRFSPIKISGYDSLFWNFGDPASGSLNTSSQDSTTHIFTAPGTYTVTLTTWTAGASGTLSHDVEIKPLPQPNLGNDTTLCSGNPLQLDAGSGFNSYHWNNGWNQQTLQVSTSGEYQVQVTDSNGCRGNDAIIILFRPVPGTLLIKHY